MAATTRYRVNPSEIKDLVTPLIAVLALCAAILCQSFRNQGPGYTTVVEGDVATSNCVNPSEIKDLVTQPTPNPGTVTAQGVNPSEIKDLVTPPRC